MAWAKGRLATTIVEANGVLYIKINKIVIDSIFKILVNKEIYC